LSAIQSTLEISKSPTPQTGSTAGGSALSSCEPWRAQIEQGLVAGLSVQRIYQDLVGEHQFTGSYYAVRRFILRQQTWWSCLVGEWNARPARRSRREPELGYRVRHGSGAQQSVGPSKEQISAL